MVKLVKLVKFIALEELEHYCQNWQKLLVKLSPQLQRKSFGQIEPILTLQRYINIFMIKAFGQIERILTLKR